MFFRRITMSLVESYVFSSGHMFFGLITCFFDQSWCFFG